MYENDKGLDYNSRHLSTEVATEKDKEYLKHILSEHIDETYINKQSHSPYTQNYLYFLSKLKEFKELHANSWSELCNFVLGRRLFVLFITCDNQDSAMMIFDTLNSRGLQLSSADILKGVLYRYYKDKENNNAKEHDTQALEAFLEQWKNIENEIEEVAREDINFDFLFLQFLYVVWAHHKRYDTSMPHVLYFFANRSRGNRKQKSAALGYEEQWLFRNETMPFFALLADFWIRPQEYLHDKALCYFYVLMFFQSISWKPFISCLLWKYKELCYHADKSIISDKFAPHLLDLIKVITWRVIHAESSTSRIAQDTIRLNANLLNNIPIREGIEHFPYPDLNIFIQNLYEKQSQGNTKFMLYLYASLYNDFAYPLSQPIEKTDLQIEHILPKSWQSANFDGWNQESHAKYLHQIGNKILLPKSSNLACSNNFLQERRGYAPVRVTLILKKCYI